MSWKGQHPTVTRRGNVCLENIMDEHPEQDHLRTSFPWESSSPIPSSLMLPCHSPRPACPMRQCSACAIEMQHHGCAPQVSRSRSIRSLTSFCSSFSISIRRVLRSEALNFSSRKSALKRSRFSRAIYASKNNSQLPDIVVENVDHLF